MAEANDIIKKDDLKRVKDVSSKLLKLLGSKSSVKVTKDKENEAIKVTIETEDETGLLIGKKGETINALQSAIGMMIRNTQDKWIRVIVDVGDWREKQEGYLKGLAEQTAERSLESGKPQTLYNLEPAQRRIVHMALSEVKGVETESQGEGSERCLIVKPVEKK